MVFNRDKIIERINRPKNTESINKARSLELRIRMHSETLESPNDFTDAHDGHMKFVRSLLPQQKHQRYKALFKPPLPTNSFIDSVYKEQRKVFEGNNAYKSVNFKGEEAKENFKSYIGQFHNYVEKECWNAYKHAINSVLMVDIDDDGNPFPRVISIFQIIDIDNDESGNIKYFIYESGDKKVFVDKSKYVVVEMEDGEIIEYNEIPHQFGYTPARQVWSENMMVTDNIVKTNNVGKSIYDLDMLLFSKISKEYNDLYAKYPIMWMLPEETGHTDDLTEESPNAEINEYEKSWMYGEVDLTSFDGGKDNLGAGSAFIAGMKEDGSFAGEPVGFVSPPIENIKFVHSDIDERKSELFMYLVGHQGEFVNEGSKNEKHLEKGLESRKSVIYDLKDNFEKIYEFYLKTMAIGLEGDEYESCYVSLGDEFYLKSVADLNEDYTVSKESGQPVSEQIRIHEQIIETKYRNNPDTKQKAMLLLHIEPYPTLSVADIVSLMCNEGMNILDSNKVKIKMNFTEYIKRYERENMPIVTAIIALGFEGAIEDINKSINKYSQDGV